MIGQCLLRGKVGGPSLTTDSSVQGLKNPDLLLTDEDLSVGTPDLGTHFRAEMSSQVSMYSQKESANSAPSSFNMRRAARSTSSIRPCR